jgi:hypothetical protein
VDSTLSLWSLDCICIGWSSFGSGSPHEAKDWSKKIMDQSATKASGGLTMSENENADHLKLIRLLQQAKPLTEPLFPDQQKKWAAESPLAQEISAILVNHPDYYDEIRAHIGEVFANPNA